MRGYIRKWESVQIFFVATLYVFQKIFREIYFFSID